MSKPIEFGKFYRLLEDVKKGDKKKETELQWLLAEYEHAKDGEGPFDELGQIFCHIGVMELYSYTGIENINYISRLETAIWKYLEDRMGLSISDYLTNKMIDHAKAHKLVEKITKKWNHTDGELENNVDGLAKYISDGIVDVIN